MAKVGRIALCLGALSLAALFIGISIWGWGGWKGFFADPARAAVCASLGGLALLTPWCGCNLSAGRRVETANDWIFPVLLVVGLAMGWASAWSDRHNRWTLGSEAVRYAGLTLFLAGTVLRIAAIRVLGHRFTVWVAVQHRHALETRGLYRLVRHPSYSGALATVFGWALVFRSTPGILIAAIMVPTLVTRIAAEERLLIEEFPREYPAYRGRSWRLVPYLY